MSTDSSSTRPDSGGFEQFEKASTDPGSLDLSNGVNTDNGAGDLDDHSLVNSIEGYRLLKRIGSGGTSIVYLAESNVTPPLHVAIKIFNRSVRDAPSQIRFNRETTALQMLDDPNIAKLIDFGVTHDNHPYIVFEFIDGSRIDDYCKSRNLNTQERVALLVTICSALQHAHDRGIVHRDMKPSNIIVSNEGTPFLTDFGLSKLFDDDSPDSEKTRTGAILGTLNYLTPEQLFATKGGLSFRTDVFGLGAILHVLLTGRPPLDFHSVVDAATSYFKKLPTRLDIKGLPAELEAICLKCLAAKPADRYASANEVGIELGRFLDGNPVQAKRPTWRQRHSRFAQQYPNLAWGVPLAFGTLLVFSSIIFGLWRKSESDLRKANEARLQAFEVMENTAQLVRTLEVDPKTLAMRAAVLQAISDVYLRHEEHVNKHPALLYKSAVANFKLAESEGNRGNVSVAKKYRRLAEIKFRELVVLDPQNEEAAFSLFHSYLWQYKYAQAFEVITKLVDDHPEEHNYRDGLCTTLTELGKRAFSLRDFDEARTLFAKARDAAESLPETSKDGRFQRKRAASNLDSARMAIVGNDFESAAKLLAAAKAINSDLNPLSRPTFGESVERLTYIQLELSMAAFQEDIGETRAALAEATRFFGRTQPTFSSYPQINAAYCRVLEDYAAFCFHQQFDDELKETAQMWQNVIDDWEKTDNGTSRLWLEKLLFSTCPFLPDTDVELAKKSRIKFLNMAPKSRVIVIGRSFLIAGELHRARRFFASAAASAPSHIPTNAYDQWIRDYDLDSEGSVKPPTIDQQSRRELLAHYHSFAASLLTTTMEKDIENLLKHRENTDE